MKSLAHPWKKAKLLFVVLLAAPAALALVTLHSQSRDGMPLGLELASILTAAGSERDLLAPEPEAVPLLLLLKSLPAQPPVQGPLSSPFGWRIDPFDGKWRFHTGIDIEVPPGTPVRAPASGVITAAGQEGGYGLHVRIHHEAAGLASVLAHLSLLASEAVPGRHVARGDVVGFSGSSGRATGPHLHFGVFDLASDEPVDPIAVFDLYVAALDSLAAYPAAKLAAVHRPFRLDF